MQTFSFRGNTSRAPCSYVSSSHYLFYFPLYIFLFSYFNSYNLTSNDIVLPPFRLVRKNQSLLGEKQTVYHSWPSWDCNYFHHLLLLHMPEKDEKEKKERKGEA